MYELIQVSENCYYVQSPAKIGVVRTGEREVCFIDSGNAKDAAKKALRILEARGWTLKAVYNTHSHADHIGGNQYLQTRTGCAIYAPDIERAFTEHPILKPCYLYGGNPPKTLRHKFLLAQESRVLPLTNDVLPDGWEIVPLPGHSFNMVGFRTPDNVVYLADCLCSPETLEKYQISFLFDAEKYVETLNAVQSMSAEVFVPSHAAPAKDVSALARLNLDKAQEVVGKILDICRTPVSFERLLQRLFASYALEMSFEQHALVGSTVKSYLTWLTESGRLQARIADNTLVWVAE